jgi:hypothetical protein
LRKYGKILPAERVNWRKGGRRRDNILNLCLSQRIFVQKIFFGREKDIPDSGVFHAVEGVRDNKRVALGRAEAG